MKLPNSQNYKKKKNPLLLFGEKLWKKNQSYKVTPCYC